ncbi:MAG: ABC-F family ATP-binding cassette domain-containing protein [Bacteroidota bacterium]|nr:ABC-F family ATP-binding cassette domain-containing protein [Bacteroidota bacterium]
MISVNQLTVQFGGVDLFKDVSFLINPKDRIGLVGKNGAGKSTMLKILCGMQQPQSGEVIIPDEAKIGYLPQQMIHQDGKTVIDEARTAFDEVLSVDKRIHELNHELSLREDYETQSYLDLIHEISELSDRFHILGGASIDESLEQTLLGLGFSMSDFHRQTKEFSGGWRMRIELAKILLRRPNVLLLDEPTNHLDIESIQWLENYIKDFSGAAVIISHDKAFLDNLTTRTIEISLGKIYNYKAAYSEYVELRKERREQQMAAYLNQKKMIEDTEDFIERFRYKATKAVQVQSRIKQLDKVERLEVDEEDNSAINIKFPPAPRSGTIVVEAKEASKRYGEKLILDNIDFVIERGEKVAFVGKNGEGKSTFSKMIMEEIDYTGHCKVGHNVSIGYFAQNQDELMDENATVFDTIDRIAVGDIRTKIRDLLGAFLFRGEEVDKKVKVLSGGERSRLAMVKLLLQPVNLLILDEPTNHLDMRSKDILKQALLNFDGTLILVSHDREFLDGLVDKVYEFRDHKIKQHLGGIYEFLQKRKLENFAELERKTKPATEQVEKEASAVKVDYLEKKEMDKVIRRVNQQVAAAEKKIEELEKELDDITHLLSNPDKIEKGSEEKLYIRHGEVEKLLEQEMSNWEQLNTELEGLKEQRFQN